MPRLPRASITPSASSMISSMLRRPSAVSILAMILIRSQPQLSRKRRSSSMSVRLRVCEWAGQGRAGQGGGQVRAGQRERLGWAGQCMKLGRAEQCMRLSRAGQGRVGRGSA